MSDNILSFYSQNFKIEIDKPFLSKLYEKPGMKLANFLVMSNDVKGRRVLQKIQSRGGGCWKNVLEWGGTVQRNYILHLHFETVCHRQM